jgi:hypothetical protein
MPSDKQDSKKMKVKTVLGLALLILMVIVSNCYYIKWLRS